MLEPIGDRDDVNVIAWQPTGNLQAADSRAVVP